MSRPLPRRSVFSVSAMAERPRALDDHQLASAVAQVRDLERVAGPQRLQSAASQWQHRARRRRARLRVGGAREPDSGRCRQPAGGVAARLDADEVPDRIDGPGPQLGSAKVRLDDTAAPDDLLRATQVRRHPVPGRRVVVRAVDAHQVHPCPQQVLDQARVVGRGAGIVTMMRTERSRGAGPSSRRA